MLRRLVILFMLVLFPLQWSVAQGHELADDAGIFAVAPDGFAQANERVIHTDEPGGICQFHQLAQASAALAGPDAGRLPGRGEASWKSGSGLASRGARLPSDIDRPKWRTARPATAVS